jgi:hypothetical protein
VKRRIPQVADEDLPEFKMKNGWVQFELPPGTPPLTNEKLDEWEKADYDEEFRRALSPRAMGVSSIVCRA